MTLDPLQERILLRAVIDILAENVPEEARDNFVRRNVLKMNKHIPAPNNKQKRQFIRAVE